MRRAFTLIETLVVISIIGTLMAIMLPVLERSRRQAQDVTGFVNLGVLSQTMSGYVTDHKDAYLAPFRRTWPQHGPYKGMTWTMACSEADPVTMRWDFARPRYAELNTEGFSKVWYSFLAEYRGGRRDDREQVSPADRDLVMECREKSGKDRVRDGHELVETSFWYGSKFWLEPSWFKRPGEIGSVTVGTPCGVGGARSSDIKAPSTLVVLWERSDFVGGKKPMAWNDFKANTNVAAADGSCLKVRMLTLYDAIAKPEYKWMTPLESYATASPLGFKSFFLHGHYGVRGRDLITR